MICSHLLSHGVRLYAIELLSFELRESNITNKAAKAKGARETQSVNQTKRNFGLPCQKKC